MRKSDAMKTAREAAMDAMIEEVEGWFIDGVNWTLRPQRILSAILRTLILGTEEDAIRRILERRGVEQWKGSAARVLNDLERGLLPFEKIGLIAELAVLAVDGDGGLKTLGKAVNVHVEKYAAAIEAGEALKKKKRRKHRMNEERRFLRS
jgi:hypothetical protein